MFLEGSRNVVWEYGRYRSTGGPMEFRLISPGGRAPRGWVVVSYRGSTNWGPLRFLLRGKLLDGMVVNIPLPPSDGQTISALVRLPDRIAALTLEPTNAPDVCTIQGFAIRDISRRAALARSALHHLRRVWREPQSIPPLARHALAVWRREGLSGVRRGFRVASGVPSPTVAFPSLPQVAAGPDRASPQPPSADALADCRLVSVIMPVYNRDPESVRSAVGSVERQTYPNWELCVSDDGSTNPLTLRALGELASRNPRIKVSRRSQQGISTATNEALRMASGDYVAFLDHNDELAPDALFQFATALSEQPDIDVLYSDEDTIDAVGRLSEPTFKPDWSPELLRGVMYVGHLLMVRRSLLAEVGGPDSAYDGVQDFELMLRLSERTDRIHHVRAILYHRRRLPGNAAATDATPDRDERQVAAVNAHLRRAGVPAIAKPHPSLPRRVILQPAPRRTSWPVVSIVILTGEAPAHLGRCLESLFSITTYPHLEVIVVDNASTDSTVKAILRQHPVTLVPFDGPFSFSRATSLGVAHARGLYVVLLNDDTEVLDPAWLQTLVFHMELPNVGVVGPLLLYPDGSVQHAGVALGLRGPADQVMRRFPADADGYAGSLCCTREVIAVTGACLMTSRQHYLDIGGLNEYYRTRYQDVDFCLRTWRMGRRILYTPRARLIHHESASRGKFDDPLDRALFRDAWGDLIARGDPFHDSRVPGYSG